MERRARNKAIIYSAKPLSDKQKAKAALKQQEKAASKALKEAAKLALLNCGLADQSDDELLKLQISILQC